MIFFCVLLFETIFKTEYITAVGTQCQTGNLVQSGGVAQFGGDITTPVTSVTPQVTPQTTNMSHQLGTVYATKRRRRNGKR